MTGIGPDRRAVLVTLAALAGCRPGKIPPAPAGLTLADAHLHLFNASDLPVRGFLTHVVLPELFSDPPDWAAALIDLFVFFYKPAAISIAAERDALERRSAVGLGGWSPAQFAAGTADHIDARADGRVAAVSADGASLAESYRALRRALADMPAIAATATMSQAQRRQLRRIAEAADGAEPVAPARTTFTVRGLGDLFRLIGWGYLMIQPRARHVAQYGAQFGGSGRRPQLMIQHLVDYDLWLDDVPGPNSGHAAQRAFWPLLAARQQPRFDVRTFAGYCPLRHAVERAEGGPTTFEALQQEWRDGRIAGFKLYPTMGFQAAGNAALKDADFNAPGRKVNALARWQRTGSPRKLGEAIDEALGLFFAFCGDRVPIMAHGSPGKGAGPGYGRRANPRFWEQVVRRHPLRLSIGHLVDDCRDFVAAAGKPPPYDPEIWALDAPLRMIDTVSGLPHEVYGDLAYSPELMGDRGFTRDFFCALREVFGAKDPELSRVLYGTDWVMFGQEANSRRFADAVARGMDDAGYTAAQQANILDRNARRFLRLP